MTGLRSAALALAFAAALACGPSSARELTSAERNGLTNAVRAFLIASEARDWEAVTNQALPPRMLSILARKSGVELSALRASLAERTGAAMLALEDIQYVMDLDNARYLELPGGEPYALIPTTTIVQAAGVKRQTVGDTVGVLDGGRWYLLRIVNPAQAALLSEAYPEFDGFTFQPETTTEVN
jgi:hypothetical protein